MLGTVAVLASQPSAVNGMLRAAGYAGALGTSDIRQLEQMKIPVWAPLLIGIAAGVGGCLFVQYKWRAYKRA